MKEEFKKWLCEKAGISITHICKYNFYCNKHDFTEMDLCENCIELKIEITLKILIKAMWAINSDSRKHRKYIEIDMMSNGIVVGYPLKDNKTFIYSEHNNSEQKALEKALEYIWLNG